MNQKFPKWFKYECLKPWRIGKRKGKIIKEMILKNEICSKCPRFSICQKQEAKIVKFNIGIKEKL